MANYKNKSVEEQILELKKQRLLVALRTFFEEQNIKRAINNPNSQYRSIYLSYLHWRKKEPKKLLAVRELWKEKDFQEKIKKLFENKTS